jgi:hypothetical protein
MDMYGIYIYILVGGLEHDFYGFPYIGNVIIPTDKHIFQRDWNHQPVIYDIYGYIWDGYIYIYTHLSTNIVVIILKIGMY